jgi:hypothetical protein
MKTGLVILLSMVLASPGAVAIAQAIPDTTTLSMHGTLDAYDSMTQTLSVATRRGTITLRLVAATRIRQGRREIDAAALEKLHGYRAVVRYSESAGTRVLQSIHVLEKDRSGPEG